MIGTNGINSGTSNHNANLYEKVIENYRHYSLTKIFLSAVRILKFDQNFDIFQISDTGIPADTVIIDIKLYFPIEDRIRECRISDEMSGFPSFIQENKNSDIENAAFNTITPGITKDTAMFDIHSNGVIKKIDGRCFVELKKADEKALDYLNQFSHIHILWWCNHFEKETYQKTMECNPPCEKAPRTGIFASRSPVRPNPVGLPTARIKKIDFGTKTIEISPIDAFDKTPVLDIKPYIPFWHRVETCKTPIWVDHWSEWHTETISPENNTITLSESEFRKLSEYSGSFKADTAEKIPLIQIKKPKNSEKVFIVVTGANENNLKNISVKIPKNRMTVITGLSGSGKSSLAFNTIYAECQRRFMDSISPTGRQFFEQFERPNVDQISNLPAAVAVEQKSISRNIRSTMGTVSDINDYLRLLFARIGFRHCPQCGKIIDPKTMYDIVNLLQTISKKTDFVIISIKTNKVKY